jgi:hypothetical protein
VKVAPAQGDGERLAPQLHRLGVERLSRFHRAGQRRPERLHRPQHGIRGFHPEEPGAGAVEQRDPAIADGQHAFADGLQHRGVHALEQPELLCHHHVGRADAHLDGEVGSDGGVLVAEDQALAFGDQRPAHHLRLEGGGEGSGLARERTRRRIAGGGELHQRRGALFSHFQRKVPGGGEDAVA